MLEWRCRLPVLITLVVAIHGKPALAEPPPPFVAGFERFARHGDIAKATAGRLLLSELSCTACHTTRSADLQPKRGPNLDGVGNRLQPDWVRRYLESPSTAHPGTTMPDVLVGLDDDNRREVLATIPAFLATLVESFPELKAGGANPLPHEFWWKGDVDRGRELYHRVGCVACHEPEAGHAGGEAEPSAFDQLLDQLDPEELAALGLTSMARPVPSVPHENLSAKYTRRGLVHFLLDPTAVRPSGRMPNLRLEPMEASDLAAYLMRDPPTPTETIPAASSEIVPFDRFAPDPFVPPDDPKRRTPVAVGRAWFAARCAHCHAVGGIEAAVPPQARPLNDLRGNRPTGCLAGRGRGHVGYELDPLQIETIVAAIGEVRRSDWRSKPEDRVELTMLRANCYGCHDRGMKGGVGPQRRPFFETAGHVDIGDEGRLPPTLDRVGAKLTEAWLGKVLAGNGNVRPFVHARMPTYPKSLVGSLPGELAQVDDASDADVGEVFGPTADLVEAGRTLLDTGCVQCHPLRGESVPGTVGVDLADVTARVRPAWFEQFLRDPAALKSRTRMPTFFPNGRSANPDVLEGDVDRQIAAMWAYLRAKDPPLPEKIAAARSHDFELIPDDRPIVLRTFVKGAGTRAVAVGFPQKVHLAFDAAGFRPAIAWRGRFLDAYGTWFVRFAPPAVPLGEDLVDLPPGLPLAVLTSADGDWPTSPDRAGYRFGGYQLDDAGVPTFLYRFGPFDVEDRIAPHDDGGLKRTLVVRPLEGERTPDRVWFRAHSGKGLKVNDDSATVPGGIVVRVPERGTVLRNDEWRVPVEVGEPLEVEYRW